MSDEEKKADEAKKATVAKPSPPPSDKPKASPARAPRVITVVAKQSERWRIGRKFGLQPIEIEAAELSAAQIKALKADPLLVVTGSLSPEDA